MNRETAKRKIETVLMEHSIITIPGLQKHRAKCYCGWTMQGGANYTRDKVDQHQAIIIVNALFGVEAELVED